MTQRSLLFAALSALLALAALLIPLPAVRPQPQQRQIHLNARMFAFEPGSVKVNQGDTVTLVLHSQDVTHGIYLDGYDVNIKAEPGKPAQATFVADRQGKFRFRCSVTCGAMHPFMIGELVVGPNLPFWRAVAALLIVVAGSVLTLRSAAPQATPHDPASHQATR